MLRIVYGNGEDVNRKKEDAALHCIHRLAQAAQYDTRLRSLAQREIKKIRLRYIGSGDGI